MDDRALMERVARKDEVAFGELVERYAGRLLAVARRLLGSRADAEDAVQRALMQCYLGAGGYQPRWALSTWLYRIVTNVCVDELRRRGVRAAHAGAADEEPRGPSRGRRMRGGGSTWGGRWSACRARRGCC